MPTMWFITSWGFIPNPLSDLHYPYISNITVRRGWQSHIYKSVSFMLWNFMSLSSSLIKSLFMWWCRCIRLCEKQHMPSFIAYIIYKPRSWSTLPLLTWSRVNLNQPKCFIYSRIHIYRLLWVLLLTEILSRLWCFSKSVLLSMCPGGVSVLPLTDKETSVVVWLSYVFVFSLIWIL